MIRFWCALSIFLFIGENLWAQNENLLVKRVALSVQDETLPQALSILSQSSGVDISYSADILPYDRKISLVVKEMLVQEALDSMLTDSDMAYRVLHGLLVIYPKKEPVQKTGNYLKGIVTDAETGKPLEGGILFDKYLGITTRTNEKGAYQLQIPNPDYTLYLQFKAEGYQNKLLRLRLNEDKWMNLVAIPEGKAVASRPTTPPKPFDSLIQAPKPVILEKQNPTEKQNSLLQPFSRVRFVKFVWPELPKISIKPDTVEGLLLMPAQATFFHPIGTNRENAKQTINRFSINLLAGYSAGVQGFELGCLINVNRFNMLGVQIGGAGNLVGGKASGLQLAGVTNTTRLRTKGGQIAGFNNFSGLDMRGFQISGFNNLVRGKMSGAQITGFNNIVTKEAVGFQLAGFANTSVHTFKGVQTSGFANVHWGDLFGWQFSGFANFAGNVRGVQLAPFFNKAKQVNGVQLGLFNLADSVAKGASIGLISIVLKGYRRIEVFGDDMGFLNLQFKTGTAKFYNILSVGGRSDIEETGWQFGYGMGSRLLELKHMAINMDATAHYMNEDAFWVGQFNMLNRFALQLSYIPGKRFAFFAGPSFKYQLSALEDFEGKPVPPSKQGAWQLEQYKKGNMYHTLSIGFQAGIRF